MLLGGFERSNLKALSQSELLTLKRAINDEMLERRVALAENISANIAAKLKEALARDFEIKIETETDEITITPDDLATIVVKVVVTDEQ